MRRAEKRGVPGDRRRRGRTTLSAVAFATVLAAAAVVSTAGSAGARCVTAGADSVSHTQCGVP